jgi:hypothetical protein
MPRQEEHEKPENLVESPGEAEQAARSLQDAADSHGTLEGYFAVNDVKDSKQLEEEARKDQKKPADREAGTP